MRIKGEDGGGEKVNGVNGKTSAVMMEGKVALLFLFMVHVCSLALTPASFHACDHIFVSDLHLYPKSSFASSVIISPVPTYSLAPISTTNFLLLLLF